MYKYLSLGFAISTSGITDMIELKIDTTYSWYYSEPTIGFHEIEAIAYDIIGQKATASVKAFFFLF